MANPFEITSVTNTVILDNKREGVATFTVRNLTRRRVRAVGKLLATPPDSPALAWVGIVPAGANGTPSATDVRDVAIDATEQYQVRVVAPADAAPGSYAFKLVVADEINPDENFSQSPDVTFTVLPPPVEEKKPLPKWLIPLIVGVVVLIGAVIALVVAEGNRRAEEEARVMREATETLEAARLTADAGTAQGIVQATETAVAISAAQSATQTAFGRYAGNWTPTVDNASAIRSMSISDGGNNRYTITYSSNCPPTGNLCTSEPLSYTVSGVAYDPVRLVAALQNTVLTLEPTSDGRLLSRMSVGTIETQQVLQRSVRVRFPDEIFAVTMMPNVNEFLTERNFDLNFLQLTPGP